MAPRRVSGTAYLLDLDGETMVFEDGTWVKFEAKRVDKTPERPHGISYSLTYHDSRNRRVIGFDNAHAIKPRRRSSVTGRRVVFDHQHTTPRDTGTPYEFESAEALVEDFWRAVDGWKAQRGE
jgi:hypothetical protein